MIIGNITNSQINPNTFKAMKPNQFKGVDYAVVRKFKAPVEKFNCYEDFYSWVRQETSKLKFKDVKNYKKHIELDRLFSINNWKEFLETKKETWSPAKIFIIFSAMFKNLKKNNNTLVPVIREEALERSFKELEIILENNKDKPFDFNKIYREELERIFLGDISANYTGWYEIPSIKHDKENFADNVEKLKLLSQNKWCTAQTFTAESYLKSGDFHIYLKEGQPKMAIKFSGCDIQEIQGEDNKNIPQEFLNELRMHLDESKYFLDDDIGYLIYLAEKGVDYY